ncbi:hypothetical protein [Massilia horti]|nr:hypothetical protein [Massilia horti]
MKARLYALSALVLVCLLAAGCQDKERPKPVTGPPASSLAR